MIVGEPTVVELVIVAEYVPSPWSVTPPKCTPLSVEEKPTPSPGTGLPFASVTVAVAVLVELPFATIELGANPTTTLVVGPTV